jgi:endonuclease III
MTLLSTPVADATGSPVVVTTESIMPRRNPAAPSIDPIAQAPKVLRRLKADYPDAICALQHDSPYQLLIATILSAQCTDERVNIVTRELFARYPTAQDMAKLPVAKLEKLVASTGFFRNKAKNIKACSQALVDQFDGQVPQDLETLVGLAGVGRKTANVVLGTAFRIPTGVVVDTHVGRLSRRLGLTTQNDAVKVEQDLIAILPKKEWIDFSHRMIWHGRKVCNARKPDCPACSMNRFCPKVGVAD